jgi:hypothetical protein
VAEEVFDPRPMSELFSRLTRASLKSPYSQKQGMSPLDQEHQTKFYEHYSKVAEEFDKEFLKKYDLR